MSLTLKSLLPFAACIAALFAFDASAAEPTGTPEPKLPVREWVVSTPEAMWVAHAPSEVTIDKGWVPTCAYLDLDNPAQSVDGFGACFNELGWMSLMLLNEADRQAVMTELFAPGAGANLAICRMPVGANDFSRDWYSYNETPGDFAMEHFSIANDRETLVPFIKSALAQNPDIKLWASPWSPPTWMKENGHYACQPLDTTFFENIGQNGIRPDQIRREGVNMFITEPDYFAAYALYFQRFIEAYRREGINIGMVMPQNEFNSCQPFPSCTWRPEAFAAFVGEYLGPAMKRLGVEVMFGTMERPNPAMVEAIVNNPSSGEYVKGVGFQWAGKEALPAIHASYPHLKLYQTEQECGNGANDWPGALYSWDLMQHYFRHGINVYDYWNIALEEGGLSRWGWHQNSLVVVDRATRTHRFTPEYYLLKHLSHYLRPGARYIPIIVDPTDAMAFRNPDGSLVVMLANRTSAPMVRSVKLLNTYYTLTLPAMSFNTIVI